MTADELLQIGATGEHLVALKFAQCGAKVYYPISLLDGVDMAVEVSGRLYKIQVKTAKKGTKRVFRLRRNRNKLYTEREVDYFALVSLDPPNVALVPYMKCTEMTVDFENLNPEWGFKAVIEKMREGGIA